MVNEAEGVVFWDTESRCIGFDSFYFEQGSDEWEVVPNYIRTASGTVYEADQNNNVLLGKRQLEAESYRSVVSSYFEQIFMLDGWKEIFEMEDDIVYNLVDHKFHIPEFIEAVNHFLEEGCPHWLAQLAEQED